MDIFSDNAVMHKVKAGDLDKMALLFERYHGSLYGFLFRMTKQKEASEDMVQNVFFRMLKYRNSFTGNGEFTTWMYHLARNVLYDHFKKNKNIAQQLDLKNIEDKIAEEEQADEKIHKREELKKLEKAMEKMDMEKRELLILCRFQKLKYREIAEILNISEAAVKVRMHRALNELRNNFLQIDE